MISSRQIGVVPLEDGRELRISLTTERRRRVLDLREFAKFSAAGVMMPGRNGVVVPVEHLDSLFDYLAEALAAARAAGWIGAGPQ